MACCTRCGEELVGQVAALCKGCLSELRQEEETKHECQRDIEQTYRREVYGQ